MAADIHSVIARRRARLQDHADFHALLLRLGVIALAVYLIFSQVFLLRQVQGLDMFPAVKDGDLAIVFRLQHPYAKNDVITYQSEYGPRFGRIVALGGDVVELTLSGELIVNGTTQSGEILYPTYALTGIEYPLRVPDDCVFVLGDYRTKAADSRAYGPIPLDAVDGKVITLLRRRGL